MFKSEKIIVVGASGSGKDYLRKFLTETKGLKYSPKTTTRPKRNHENDGVDYNFITESSFINGLNNNEFKVYEIHMNDKSESWYYGIDNQNFENNQVFIMTPGELKFLSEEDRTKCFVVYLDIDRATRKSRILERMDSNDSVERRLETDERDFEKLIDYDLRLTDPEFDAEIVYDLMN
jgi:guanylate kinase